MNLTLARYSISQDSNLTNHNIEEFMNLQLIMKTKTLKLNNS